MNKITKRNQETININGNYFKVVATVNANNFIDRSVLMGRMLELTEAYDNPSDTKELIYHNWVMWAEENDGVLRVDTYNSMQFTLRGFVYHNNKKYYLYITKTRQEAYKLIY